VSYLDKGEVVSYIRQGTPRQKTRNGGGSENFYYRISQKDQHAPTKSDVPIFLVILAQSLCNTVHDDERM